MKWVWDPFEDFKRLEKEIDSLFSDFWLTSRSKIARLPESAKAIEKKGEEIFLPALDMIEKEGKYVLTVDLPGVDKKDIKIKVKEDTVIIEAETKREKEEKSKCCYYMERAYGKIYREIPLPSPVKEDEVKAKFENGVLEIELPIRELPKETEGKEITIP